MKGEVRGDAIDRSIRYAIERRQAADEKHRLVHELEAAKELLEKKNQRLAMLYETAHQFVDNVSHEFRTPLTVIKEFTSIVREGLAGSVDSSVVDEMDSLLQSQLHSSDFALSMEEQTWVILLACDDDGAHLFQRRLHEAIPEVNRNRFGPPLPEIEFEVKGAWRSGDRPEELVARSGWTESLTPVPASSR